MPYYSELGIYTPSSSYTSPLLKGPYSTHSSILASNIMPPSTKFTRSNFRGFKPHLTTISESNMGVPLRRITSPKVLYHTSPKARVPRPIKINTSDIDVSLNRYNNRNVPLHSKPQKSTLENESHAPEKEPSPVVEKEAKPNTEIRRDRATIRLETVHKDTLEKEIGEIKSWRDNFKPSELVTEGKRRKKSPGEILKEKFLIRSKSKDNVPTLEPPTLSRKSSVKKSPSFKDICDVITSDPVVEDLNPGQPFEVRRRQSRKYSKDVMKQIQRSSSTLSVEEVQILDALLQAEQEVGLYDEPLKSARRRRVAKKKSSENLEIENEHEASINNLTLSDNVILQHPPTTENQLKHSASEKSIPDPSKSYSKLRKESSLKDMVKDISQVEIEMIPVKQKPVITGSIGNIEEKIKSNLKAVVEDLQVEESPKQEIKEKKPKFNVTVQEFPVKKKINFPKHQLGKNDFSAVQIPNAKTPIIGNVVKKRSEKCLSCSPYDDQIKEKPAKKVKTLEKSLSEVQVRNKEPTLLKKSGSNDSVHSNFTVLVNRTGSDDPIETRSSPRGSGKLKIISIENTADKTSKATPSDREVKANIKETIPKIESKPNVVNPEEESSKTVTLLRSTRKELKPDTFLSKREIGKKPDVRNLPQETQQINNTGINEMGFRKEGDTIENNMEICDINKSTFEENIIINDFDGNKPKENDSEINHEIPKPNNLETNTKTSQDSLKDAGKNNLPSTQINQIAKDSLEKHQRSIKNETVVQNDDVTVCNFREQQNTEQHERQNLKKLKLEQKDPSILLKDDSLKKHKETIKNENKEKNETTKECNFWEKTNTEQHEVPKVGKLILEQKDAKTLLKDDSLKRHKQVVKSESTEKKQEVTEFWENQNTEQQEPSKLSKLKPEQKDPKNSDDPLKNKPAINNENTQKKDTEESTFLEQQNNEPSKLNKLKLELKDHNIILKENQECQKASTEEEPETPEEIERRLISKRSLVEKANKNDPDLRIFEPPTPPPPEPVKEPSPEPSFVPLQSNRLSQWMHPWKKPEQQDVCPVEIYAKPKFIRARHIPRKWVQNRVEESESEDSTTSEEDSSSEEESEEEEDVGAQTKVGASTSSTDSGFESGRAKDNGSIDSRDSPALHPASNPAFALDFNDIPEGLSQSSTYQSFQRSGRITPPATTIPRFRKYCVDDFNFLKVLGKGSFGKVLLAELKGTEYYYAIKCLKKDVVLEDDDVECTLIERKVLALGTKHPYLCHLLCTFQTESHLFFVMEYLNGGDLMFHIQAERRFSEVRARFYGAEIISGLKFLHNKGIVYRDLKLDNILLDFDGHVRIADFGMCKLQIFLDRMADTFCGTPDYMAPEIIKGQHYNQCVDWWSFGVLLYEMLLGQSPFSGNDEDELFWSICNEKPVIPRFLSAEAGSVLVQFLEKDANKRLGNRFSPHGDIQDHVFFKAIDWMALEARRLEPPFKPNLQHPLDTQYFDKTFTTEKAKLTAIETGILHSMDQTQFQGFSYTNPNATDK